MARNLKSGYETENFRDGGRKVHEVIVILKKTKGAIKGNNPSPTNKWLAIAPIYIRKVPK